MELPSNILEQIAFNTELKIEEHILIVMDKSTHEKHLSQLLQTNNKQFKTAATFSSVHNVIFNVTNSNDNFFPRKFTNQYEFVQINIPPDAYEIESLHDEIKRIFIDQEHYTELNYPFHIKPNFSTLGSIIEISPQGPIISFVFNDSIGNVLGFDETILSNEFNISANLVDVSSFDTTLIHTGIAHGMVFKTKRTDIIHKFSMYVNLGYKYIEKLRDGIQRYMMNSKDFNSSNIFFEKMKMMCLYLSTDKVLLFVYLSKKFNSI